MMNKKIITEENDEFYIKFSGGITSELKLNLYSSSGQKKLETVKVHNYYIKMKKLELSTIKFYTKQAIDNYRRHETNQSDFIKWDGYIGDEGPRKKEIMRDRKIRELLKGDTAKLEDFLDIE